MSLTRLSLVSFVLVAISCKTMPPPPPPPVIDKEWTLESTPNKFDVPGVVFAINENGEQVRIPGGRLDVVTLTSPVQLTQQSKQKNVSYGAMVNFLGLKNIGSNSNLQVKDSTHLEALFSVKDGSMVIIDDDVAAAFEKKSKTISSNLATFNLDKTQLFLVLEAIKSPNVSITLSKNTQGQASAIAEIGRLLNINGNIKRNADRANELVYSLNDSLVIFYKLKKINVNVIGTKGEPSYAVDLSLGNTIKADELPYKRKGEDGTPE